MWFYLHITFVILIAYYSFKSYFLERGIFLSELDIHLADVKSSLCFMCIMILDNVIGIQIAL
jgi:hypothetical protein